MAQLRGIKACVFDAYGTLFDVNSAAAQARDALGERWQPLAELWRARQLQYTWLRSLMGRYADFRQVTREALDFALASFGIDDAPLAERLMQLYLQLEAYPEVSATLARLKSGGMKLAILSNGEPKMLAAAAANSGVHKLFDAILSVDAVQVYKPDPRVYRLPEEQFGLAAADMCFVSANGWDAYAAKAYGYRVLWCNRFAQAAERMPDEPDACIANLAEMPSMLGL